MLYFQSLGLLTIFFGDIGTVWFQCNRSMSATSVITLLSSLEHDKLDWSPYEFSFASFLDIMIFFEAKKKLLGDVKEVNDILKF